MTGGTTAVDTWWRKWGRARTGIPIKVYGIHIARGCGTGGASYGGGTVSTRVGRRTELPPWMRSVHMAGCVGCCCRRYGFARSLAFSCIARCDRELEAKAERDGGEKEVMGGKA